MYKQVYQTGRQVPKRDRFGVYARVEQVALECMTFSVEAALTELPEKIVIVKRLRIHIDILKRLVRLCQELDIIEAKRYFSLQEKLIEASKMAHGWLAYLQRKEPLKRSSFP
ncbi:MAG: four helix bundle protein [bacterium]|nr:four helix bundle protein [bacterium]